MKRSFDLFSEDSSPSFDQFKVLKHDTHIPFQSLWDAFHEKINKALSVEYDNINISHPQNNFHVLH